MRSGGDEHGDFDAPVALREDRVHPSTFEFEGQQEEGAEEEESGYVEDWDVLADEFAEEGFQVPYEMMMCHARLSPARAYSGPPISSPVLEMSSVEKVRRWACTTSAAARSAVTPLSSWW